MLPSTKRMYRGGIPPRLRATARNDLLRTALCMSSRIPRAGMMGTTDVDSYPAVGN
jgi:hypothetical protein